MSDTKDNATDKASAADVKLFDFYVAQLEAYLDGELNSEEAVTVRRRLIQEEAYAAALGRLHAQRVQRLEVFKQIEREETNDAAVVRLTDSARQLAVQGRGALAWPTWTKIVFGMAACLLVGFAGGLIGEYNVGTPPVPPNSTPYTAPGGAEGFTGWVRMENGKPIMELPPEKKPLQDLMYIPDRTLPEQPQ